MRKAILYIYGGLTCILLGLFFFQYITFQINVDRTRNDEGYRLLTEYERTVETDADAPIGKKEVYRLYLHDVEEGNSELVFYTIHQNVRILVDGEEVYSLTPAESNLFGRTPGCFWNSIPLYVTDAGKEIRVELIPAYKSSLGIVPDFYVGSRFHIWINLLKHNAISFLLSLVAIAVGFCFIIYIIYNFHNSEIDKSLMMLGFFSVAVGVWQFTDTTTLGLLFPENVALAYVPFMALMLITVPFVMFFKELQSSRDSRWWYVPCIFSFVCSALQTALLVAGVADLRETLWLTHLVLGTDIAVVAGMILREVLKHGWNRRLKLNVLCMLACFLGLAVDLFVYYASHGSGMMVFGMFGFLTYIIVLGLVSVKDAKNLMDIGMRAKRYERMAFHDQLTGLYNRTAYAEDINAPDFTPERHIVIMFDLNNLKKCNDTLGHETGDKYITESAGLIREVFEDVGKCYRLGGDEFCVLAEGLSPTQCRQRIRKLKDAVAEANRERQGFKIQIACGCELYDSRIDYDIGDTARRADREMYQEKFNMKREAEA